MSQENVEIVRRVLTEFGETQHVPVELFSPNFIFDLSTFQEWPGQQEFTGIEDLSPENVEIRKPLLRLEPRRRHGIHPDP
jgi:hypothetical protein